MISPRAIVLMRALTAVENSIYSTEHGGWRYEEAIYYLRRSKTERKRLLRKLDSLSEEPPETGPESPCNGAAAAV